MSSYDAARWLRASRRQFILRDLYTFAKHSGYCPDIEEEPYRDVCDWLESLIPKPGESNEQQLAMLLLPRLTFKTSLISALTTYALIKEINLRFVLGRATLGMSKQTLAGVRDALSLYPDLQELFGDLVTTAETWSTTEVRLSGRSKAMREPSIDTVGLDTSRTGSHPDFVILDDLVHEGNYESAIEQQRARTLVQAYYPILERWGTLLLVGTRWGDNDVYGWVLEQERMREEKGLPPRWKTFIRGAYNSDGSLFVPYVLSQSRLDDLQSRTDSKLFSAWYLNEPRAEGERIFPASAIRYFDGDFYPGAIPQFVPHDPDPFLASYGTHIPLYVVATCDPAPTVGPKSDETGFTVVGFGPDDLILWLHAEGVKMLPADRLNHLVYLCYTYQPHILSIENADIDAVLLQDKLDAAGLRTRVQGFNPRTDRKALTSSSMMPRGRHTKEAQIESLQPYLPWMRFLRGKTEALTRQMIAYPYLDYDDVLDAASFALFFRKVPDTEGGDLEALFWKHDEEAERREFEREAYPVEPAKRGRALAWGGPGTPTYR